MHPSCLVFLRTAVIDFRVYFARIPLQFNWEKKKAGKWRAYCALTMNPLPSDFEPKFCNTLDTRS